MTARHKSVTDGSGTLQVTLKVSLPSVTEIRLWRGRWSAVTWRAYLDAGVTESQLAAIRRSTYSGRPLGSQEFTCTLEKEIKRRLAPQKRGPKKKADKSENQETFSFGA
jgi:hypothetical protein